MCDTSLLSYLAQHSHQEPVNPLTVIKIETLYHEYLNTARWRQIVALTFLIGANTIMVSFKQLIGEQFLAILVFANIIVILTLLVAMKKIKRPLLVEMLINNKIHFIELKQMNNLHLKSSIMRIVLAEIMSKRIPNCIPGENFYDRYF